MSLLGPPRGASQDPNAYNNSRPRITSSGAYPHENQGRPANQQRLSYYSNTTNSSNTFSSSGSYGSAPHTMTMSTASMYAGGGGGGGGGFRPPTNSSDLRRSTSSRSGGSVIVATSGYVALLRKQKATVWCDRPQAEDPTLMVQRQNAKMRARHELWQASGGSGSGGSGAGYSSATVGSTGRTNTGLGASSKMGKIRHAKPSLLGFNPGENHVGVGGVPLRLSATEVEGESSGDDDSSLGPHHHHHNHRRNESSGRSSVGSGRRGAAYRSGGGLGGSQSSRRRSPDDTPERSGSLAEERPENLQNDRFVSGGGGGGDGGDGDNRSFHSGDDAEAADGVGELGAAPRLASKSLMYSAMTREKSVKSVDELRRRGSVDERTSTLTGMSRLYIANPD